MKKILAIGVIILFVGMLSGCIDSITNESTIIDNIKLTYSDDNKTVLVYIGDSSTKLIVNTINNLIDDGYVYIGSYTTKRGFSSYSNEAFLIFRLDEVKWMNKEGIIKILLYIIGFVVLVFGTWVVVNIGGSF